MVIPTNYYLANLILTPVLAVYIATPKIILMTILDNCDLKKVIKIHFISVDSSYLENENVNIVIILNYILIIRLFSTAVSAVLIQSVHGEQKLQTDVPPTLPPWKKRFLHISTSSGGEGTFLTMIYNLDLSIIRLDQDRRAMYIGTSEQA